MTKSAQHHGRSLVIVESPSKAKTINRYLGPSYTVKASMGHVRDLPAGDLGIDLTDNFAPVYEILLAKRKIINELKKAVAKVDSVYLATDLDREGEAIAWHLLHALDLDIRTTKRVVFNEITKSAIAAAFAHPHELDMDKVNAQQARRLLDRIVGYQLSPLISRKIAKGLSAGRVQSVTVRVVVEREREIRAFVPKQTWSVHACLATDPEKADTLVKGWMKLVQAGRDSGNGLTQKKRTEWLSKHACLYAELIKVGGKEFSAESVEQARATVEALGFVVASVEESDWADYPKLDLKLVALKGRVDREAAPPFSIKDVQTRRTTTKPSPPFTTAALQQAASTNLGFAPSKTMRVAQQLYEGIDLGDKDGPVGLITYMRTDSTNLSQDSVNAVRGLINDRFGEEYVPAKPNIFGKTKRAQEAHEAVRPSDASLDPGSLKRSLSAEQHKLYELIWRRFVGCQMMPAKWDNTTILASAETPQGEAIFRTTGRRLVFDGFLRVMPSSRSEEVVLPELAPGGALGVLSIDPKQQYTSPPPRLTEASLVKKLESEGIGRPSTYAAIVQTIQDRDYVKLIDKRLHATDRGEIVTDKLVAHFPKIMDLKFTSHMEDELDKIEDAHFDWVHVLNEFYQPFKKSLEAAMVEMEPVRAMPSEYTCPDCGKEMVYRLGKNGRFLSCGGYPDCKTSMNIDDDGKPIEPIVSDEPCEVCGKEMAVKKSRRGLFLGCSGYPNCTNTKPCDEEGVALRKVSAADIKEQCPDCNSPMVVKFAKGSSFLGCGKYPKCKATKPMPPGIYVEKPKPAEAGVGCDKCGRPMVIRTGRRGPFLSCSGFPRCRNAMPMEKIDELRAKAEAGEIPDPPPDPPPGKPVGAARATRLSKEEVEALGPPPPGFAWTRTGRPVVEVWPDEPLACWQCGREMLAKNGRFGPYFSCEKYPKCKTSANLRGEAKKRGEIEFPSEPKPEPIPTDIACDECGSLMTIRSGRTGPFLGCGTYPKCKATKPFPEGETVESLTGAAAQG